MPSGYNTVHVEPPQQDPAQVKLCTACRSALVDNTTTPLYLPQPDAAICIGCREREHVLSSRNTLLSSDSRLLCIDVDPGFTPPASLEGGSPLQNTRHTPEISSYDDEMITDEPAEPDYSYHGSIIPPAAYSSKPKLLVLQCDTDVTSAALHHNHTSTLTHTTIVSPKHTATPSPNPLTDITRLRIRPQGHHCLHPGATFQGTQKSGRNSYDVNVTIVVCFAISSSQYCSP